MPVLRVSSQLWKEVSKLAGDEGVSLSYALDKIIDGLRKEREDLLNQLDELAKTRPKAKPRQKRKAKAATSPEPAKPIIEPMPETPKARFRCFCGQEFPDLGAARSHLKATHPAMRKGIKAIK